MDANANNYYPQKADANVDANNLSAASANADMNANIKTMRILDTSLLCINDTGLLFRQPKLTLGACLYRQGVIYEINLTLQCNF